MRDYFTNKATQQEVNDLFRDLATQCAVSDEPGTLAAGFAILSKVEGARAAKQTGDPADGAMVVFVAWGVMEQFACGSFGTCPADLGKLTKSLTEEGAFGVRGTGYDGSTGADPVYSWGNVAGGIPYWGVEPFGTALWSDVLAGGTGLVFGYPDYDNTPGSDDPDFIDEEPLGLLVPYDWNVLPGTAGAVSVTMCADAPDGKKEKVAHAGSLLQDGNDGDLLCANAESNDPLAEPNLSGQLVRLASAVLPFWPQELYATVAGGSASGKATEFSPYLGYQLDPEGRAEFITVPGDATAFAPVFEGEILTNAPSGLELICAAGDPIESGEACPPGREIRVHLTTSRGSLLTGDQTVLMVITAQDNNGSWTLYGTFEGVRDDDPGTDLEGNPYGLVYSWNNLALDKPGAYKLHTYRTNAVGCVFDDDGNRAVDDDGVEIPCGPNSVGIAFPGASSVKFVVNP